MDAPKVSALAAVFGSLAGEFATVATAWATQRTYSKRELVRAELSKREALDGKFISECFRLFMDSLVPEFGKPEAMLPVYALLNRIRVSASDAVLAEAANILKRLTEQYFSPNLSLEEPRSLVESRNDSDPLKPFGDACRAELRSMERAV